MDKIGEKYNLEKDEVYGFDFAVYPKTQNVNHSHSLALIMTISDNQKMKEIEKWIKICHSVKKELWINLQGNIQKIKLSNL